MSQISTWDLPGSPLPGATGLPLINAMIKALLSQNSGPTAPEAPVPGMLWRDTSTTPHTPRVRNSDNTAWIALTSDLGFTAAGVALVTAADAAAQSALLTPPCLIVRDVKATGVQGGTFTAGAWRTRDLNTVAVNTIAGASVASNRITLPAGIYRINAGAPAYRVSSNRTRLQRITPSAVTLVDGSAAYSGDTAYNANAVSQIVGRFSLTAESQIELQHYCTNTTADNGFGIDGGSGSSIYAQVMIERIGNA